MCFSDKTVLAHFETPQVTLSDIKNVMNNEFNLPAEMFSYRCCEKRLNQSSIIHLPCSIHVDVALLGGGKNPTPGSKRSSKEECDICKRRIGRGGRPLDKSMSDVAFDKLRLDAYPSYTCQTCRRRISELMPKTTCANIPKGSHMPERFCDMCDKSPRNETSPVHLDKEKEDYTLKVLRRRCTYVCKNCSDNLADLVKKQTKLSQSGACSEMVLDMQASSNITSDMEPIGSGGTSENASECVKGNEDTVYQGVGSDHGVVLAEMQESDTESLPESIKYTKRRKEKALNETIIESTHEKEVLKCFLCKFVIKGVARKLSTGTVDDAGAKICSNCYNNLRRKQTKENSVDNICKCLEKEIKLKEKRLEQKTVDADSIYEVVWRKVLLKLGRQIRNGTLKVFMLDACHKDLVCEFQTALRALKRTGKFRGKLMYRRPRFIEGKIKTTFKNVLISHDTTKVAGKMYYIIGCKLANVLHETLTREQRTCSKHELEIKRLREQLLKLKEDTNIDKNFHEILENVGRKLNKDYIIPQCKENIAKYTDEMTPSLLTKISEDELLKDLHPTV